MVADEDLQRRGDQAAIHSAIENITRAAAVARCRAADATRRPRRPRRRREIGGDHHMDEAVGEGRIEDDRPPVDRNEPPVGASCSRAGVCIQELAGEDPGGARSACRSPRGRSPAKCRPRPTLPHAEQHDAEEARPRGRRRSAPRSPSAGRSPGRPCRRIATSWCRTGSSSRRPRRRPCRSTMAKIFSQYWKMSRYTCRPVPATALRARRGSSRGRSRRPGRRCGTTMVKANCTRARCNASRGNIGVALEPPALAAAGRKTIPFRARPPRRTPQGPCAALA